MSHARRAILGREATYYYAGAAYLSTITTITTISHPTPGTVPCLYPAGRIQPSCWRSCWHPATCSASKMVMCSSRDNMARWVLAGITKFKGEGLGPAL